MGEGEKISDANVEKKKENVASGGGPGVRGQCWTEKGCKWFFFATGGSVETIFLAPRASTWGSSFPLAGVEGRQTVAGQDGRWTLWHKHIGGRRGGAGRGRAGWGKKDNAFLYLCLPA